MNDPRLIEFTAGVAVLKNRLAMAEELKAQTVAAVAHAKGIVSLKDHVDGVLIDAERMAHDRSLGQLEKLLTALMGEVLPRENQAVSLRLETKRSLPALDIVVSQDGNDEDVIKGRGKSVANVLSAGLRFIAVARSGCRPFVVLDEADCWLSAARVTQFFDVVADLSRKLGIQVLFISHHDPDQMSGFPVHLTRKNTDSGVSKTVATHPDIDTSTNHGLRGIRLINFMAHEDTFIPLHAEMTHLTGENDVGKSVVTEAILAVTNDSSSDAMIRHGADKAVVKFLLNGNRTITWERVRKGSPKVMYRLTDDNNDDAIIREGSNQDGVPDWAAEAMGIFKLDGMDVQVRSQINPVFLLDESEQKRASILSIGRESGHLKTVREIWKARIADSNKAIKTGEAAIKRCEKIIALIDSDDLDRGLMMLTEQHNDLAKSQQTEIYIRDHIQKMDLMSQWACVLDRIGHAPELAILHDPSQIVQQSARITTLRVTAAALENIPSAPVLPRLRDASQANQYIRLRRAADILSKAPQSPVQPPLKDVAMIAQYIKVEKLAAVLGRMPVKPVPEPCLRDPAPVETVMKRIVKGRAFHRLLQRTPAVVPPVKLRETRAAMEYVRLHKEVASLMQAVSEADAKLAEESENLDALILEIGYCPVCRKLHNEDHNHSPSNKSNKEESFV